MTILTKDAEGESIKGLWVRVREYLRYRLGQWELVRSHIRKWPCSRRAKSQVAP
jgi:hypothetical protein